MFLKKGQQKTPLHYAMAFVRSLSDSALNLVGTEASGTSVHMARSTVDNSLDPLYIGLPSTIGTTVGVGNLNTEGYALATIITLRHNCTSNPHEMAHQNHAPKQALRYDSRHCEKKQVFFWKIFCFFKIILIFLSCAVIMFLNTGEVMGL